MELPPVTFVAEFDQATGQFVMVGFHLLRARAVQPGHAIAQRRRRGVKKFLAARSSSSMQ
jgi:hypothetical protein